MAKYNVMINRTRTIEESVEIEVSAKDEGAAQEKAEKRVDKANKDNKEDRVFDWEETSREDSYEYEVSES